jgi:hypothetical protein
MSSSSVPPARRNSLTDELEAMAAIGHALDSLLDREAQQRVLRWAFDRLHRANTTSAAEPRGGDPTLDLEGLHDLFER